MSIVKALSKVLYYAMAAITYIFFVIVISGLGYEFTVMVDKWMNNTRDPNSWFLTGFLYAFVVMVIYRKVRDLIKKIAK